MGTVKQPWQKPPALRLTRTQLGPWARIGCECGRGISDRRFGSATGVAGLDSRAAASRNAGRKSGRCDTPKGGKAEAMSEQFSPARPRRREVIKAGIAAGATALLPWQGARAELPPVARNLTMILLWVGRAGRVVDQHLL